MNTLFHIAGVSEPRIDWARGVMARHMRRDLDAIIEQAAHDTTRIPGYEHIHVDRIRPNTRKSMQAILEVLGGADYEVFGAALQSAATQRARQGVDPRALFTIVDFTERIITTIATACLQGLEEHVLGVIIGRRICDGGRQVVAEAFRQAHLEARADLDRLAGQFSAPILPALPGVLVLPIVGAISQLRAQQIVDALLAGVVTHAAHTAILDLTGITDADADLASHLRRATDAVRLLGARLVLAGISPHVARILVDHADGPRRRAVHATLADALMAASATPSTPSTLSTPSAPSAPTTRTTPAWRPTPRP